MRFALPSPMVERGVASLVDPRRVFFTVPETQYSFTARTYFNLSSVLNFVASPQGERVPAGPKRENQWQFLQRKILAKSNVILPSHLLVQTSDARNRRWFSDRRWRGPGTALFLGWPGRRRSYLGSRPAAMGAFASVVHSARPGT
jgi:hypothetical protein